MQTSPTRRAVPSPDVSVWIFVAFTGIVFGAGGLLAKGLVDDGVDPFTVTWFPFLAAGGLAMAVAVRRSELRAEAMVAAIVLGVTTSAAPALLFNLGFESLSAGVVTLLISLGPVFTAAVAHFVFPDERFNQVKGAGLVLAILGVAILAAGQIEGEGSASGIVLVVCGAMAAGGGAVLARRYATTHGAMALIGPQLLTGGAVALLLGSLLGRDTVPSAGFEPWHVASMLGFGITTYLGFLSMLKANEVGTTGQVSVIGYCVPLFGVVGGVIIFGDAITWSLVVGGLMILISVSVIAAGSSGRVAAGPRSVAGATGAT